MILLFLSATVDATYEAVGKHTYLTMTINSVLLGIALLAFAALYKQLAPRVYNVGSDGSIENATVIKLKGKLPSNNCLRLNCQKHTVMQVP